MELEINGINYQDNIDHLLQHKNQIDDNLNILENGNNQFFGNDNLEYKNHLFKMINNNTKKNDDKKIIFEILMNMII